MESNSTAPGKVFLVGAGPGSPDLLTWRAIKLMQHCDVVCYDLLVSPAILSLVPSDKEMLAVGYRGYCGTSIEYGMHPDVIAQALAGKNVLRLKSGDPFIFGRGTEECRCLNHHGIEYEVVPGITSALGAAAYAGFPLTSNGLASDVTFASGHRASSVLNNWASMGQSSGTLVLYMAAKKLAQHAARLIEQGRDPETAVALVSSATRHNQRLLTTTLAKIDEVMDNDMHQDGSPVLVIMGQVVALAPELSWHDKLPLTGNCIMMDQSQAAIAEVLRMAGAEIILSPAVTKQYGFAAEDWAQILKAPSLWLENIDAVKGLEQSAKDEGLDVRQWSWQLSGSQPVQAYLADKGINIALADKMAIGMLALTSGTKSNQGQGMCGCRASALAPRYDLGKVAVCWVEEPALAELITQTQVGFDCELFITSQADIAKQLALSGKDVVTLASACVESVISVLVDLPLRRKSNVA
ncbi:uroporphyrinogen-III C-methyltransferase [Shewanella benthica]|uniref:uroporphyrinogen-III C-methyltransferase n=1 Tax=Shewanella benthica KT99 TaxID=314608 RepID=A9D3D6_9GAMM|nr:uroporphyrinogen-III C-methyltransferase [Shewanella benthica]EDQ01667.1 siroheme synthase [Shewanella benthica KT99]